MNIDKQYGDVLHINAEHICSQIYSTSSGKCRYNSSGCFFDDT